MTIHLKDIQHTQNGKRWSQVMYLNFLLKYKIQVEKCEKLATLKYEAPNFVETTERLDPHHCYIMGKQP